MNIEKLYSWCYANKLTLEQVRGKLFLCAYHCHTVDGKAIMYELLKQWAIRTVLEKI